MIRRVLAFLPRIFIPFTAFGVLAAMGLNTLNLPRELKNTAVAQQESLSSRQLICPGPQTIGLPGTAATAPTPVQLSAAHPTPKTPATGALSFTTLDAKPLANPRLAPNLASASSTAASAIQITGTESFAPGLIAEQTSLTTSGDLRGLATSACQSPSHEQWLVGGGGAPGRRGRLILTNPQAVTAQISIDLLDATGPLPRTAGNSLGLAPRTRTIVLLDALAANLKAPVVHVRSTGAEITATLNDTWLEGTLPRGTDDLTPGLPPTRSLVVPGITVGRTGAELTALRIAVPGAEQAVVQVRILGERGPTPLPDAGVLRVPAGSSRELSLGKLPPGQYAAQLTADVPILAGATSGRRVGDGPADFAWAASAAPLTTTAGVTGQFPEQTTSSLLVTAPDSAAQITVRTNPANAAPTSTLVSIAGGSTRLIPTAPGQPTWIEPQPGSGPVVAARVLYRPQPEGAFLAVSALNSAPLRTQTVRLYPQD